MNGTLDNLISLGLLLLLVFTALAFGTVEPWSLAVFELATVFLLAFWSIKGVVEGKITLLLPPIFWPLLALFGFGLLQSVVITGADGLRKSLSVDVEATRLTVLTLFCLIGVLLMFANFLVRRQRGSRVFDLVLLRRFDPAGIPQAGHALHGLGRGGSHEDPISRLPRSTVF